MLGNTRSISRVEHDISHIMFNTRNKSGISAHPCILFSIYTLYIQKLYVLSCTYGVFPSWLWSWVVFNTNSPLLPEWIRNYHEPFLRYKMAEISLGKTLKVWCLKSADLPEHIVTRVEYGTSYYRWRDIQVAAMRVHGGPKGLDKFMLRRCWRSRGYVERAFERIRNGTFTLPNKCEESSAQFAQATHSMQIAELFAQIANASRQIGSASGQSCKKRSNFLRAKFSMVANLPQNVVKLGFTN